MANNKKKVERAAKKAAKKHPKIVIAIAIILVIIIVATVVLWFVKPEIFHKLIGTGEHDWEEWTIDEQATCVDPGNRSRECKLCGEFDEESIPANGHVWGASSEVLPATCGDGVTVHTCTVCGEDEEVIVPGTGNHEWKGWVTVTQATCGDGKKQRECSVCTAKDEQVIEGSGDHSFGDDNICTVCGYDNSSPEVLISSSEVSIHFLELGNKYAGDCTLIKCGDTEILIDAGSRQDSAVTIKDYVDKYCTDGVLEYVIATHAHQDHIAGFVGTGSARKTGIMYQYKIGTIIQFAGHNTNSSIYKNYCAAVEYAQSNGTAVYTAEQCWNEKDGAKKQYYIDGAESVSINILYNYYYDHKASNENDYSVCMLLTQQTGGKTYNYLFTGDLEEKGESYLVDNNSLPEVELFKGGHHGSYTASTEKLLSVIKPKNVAVCCCCGAPEYTQNPDNTFPSQAFIDRVSKYTQNIYCTSLATGVPEVSGGKIPSKSWNVTSMNGNIVFYVKAGKIELFCSNNATLLKDTEWFKSNRIWKG